MTSLLITRPLAAAQRLAEKIKASKANIQTFIFPTIEIIDINTAITINSLNYAIDFIIFISPIAVEKSVFLLSMLRNNIHNIKILAIGKSTAEALQEHGITHVIFPHQTFSSESLLALPELKKVQHKKILICKGEGGNPLLSETLRLRGATVTEAILYKRCLPQVSFLPKLDKIDLILCTSCESMDNLLHLFNPDAVTQKRLLVSSEKLQTLARTRGFILKPLLANNAGDQALIDALTCYQP